MPHTLRFPGSFFGILLEVNAKQRQNNHDIIISTQSRRVACANGATETKSTFLDCRPGATTQTPSGRRQAPGPYDHNCFVASCAPSRIASNFAHTTVGCTSVW